VRPNCVSRARTAPKASRKILFNQTTNTTLSGSFSGANLVKTGSGTLTVNGSNTHTGTLGGSSQIIINNGSSFLVIADATGLDAYLNGISFYSGSGTGLSENGFDQGFSGIGTEIIAVLETETYLLAVALLTGLFVQYIRCRAKQKLLKNHRPDFATHAAAHQRDRLPRDAALSGAELHGKAAIHPEETPMRG